MRPQIAIFFQILNVFFSILDHSVLSEKLNQNIGLESSVSMCSVHKNCSACTEVLQCAWCPGLHIASHPQCIEYRNAGFCNDFVYTNNKVAGKY